MPLSATDLLVRAGWTPDRRVVVDDQVARLRDGRFDVVPPYRDLMAQLSGLVVVSDDGRTSVEFVTDDVLVVTGPPATHVLDRALPD